LTPAVGAPRRLAPIFLLLIAAGLAVRIAGATGEIWLDEIWSLRLIAQMKAGNVLPSLAIDNNHYLNTAYLALVGGDGEPLTLRAFSILLGTSMVAAAGWLQRDRGAFTVIATMALFAFTFPLVNVGSEARGYAGMLLCALLAIDAMERLADRPQGGELWLAIVAVTGVLFHPLMLGFIASLGLWTIWDQAQAGAGLRVIYTTVRDRFGWTVRLLIPLVAIIGIAVHFGRSGYVLGGIVPFSPDLMAGGIARLYRFLLGLPDATPTALIIALVLAILCLAVLLRRPNDSRLALYLIVIFGMPAAMAIARLPNTEIPRYYLLPGIVFLLLLSDLLGTLWARNSQTRAAAIVALLAVLVGNALELRTFFELGRGDVTAMLNRIVAEGPGPITSNTETRDRPVITYFLRRMKIDQPYVSYAEVCKTPPRWMLTSDLSQSLPDHASIGSPDCDLRFLKVEHYTSWGLSGFPWTLYKAE